MKKKFSKEFKKRVAIEALRERKTTNEMASLFQVSPRLVQMWKKKLLDEGELIFGEQSHSKKTEQDFENREKELHKKIGQLTMELDWLKKKLLH